MFWSTATPSPINREARAEAARALAAAEFTDKQRAFIDFVLAHQPIKPIYIRKFVERMDGA